MHSHALVAGLWLQKQQAAADLPVHQEVVLEEVQHSVWKLQGRADLPFPGTVGDALKKAEAGCEQQESERRHASIRDSSGQPRPTPRAPEHSAGPKTNWTCEETPCQICKQASKSVTPRLASSV